MNTKHYILFFYLFIGVGFSCFSQSRKELEAERRKIKNEIYKVNSLLFKTKKSKTNALDDLKDINLKINARKRLINAINSEAKALSREIYANEREISKLSKKLDALRASYADIIFKAYKSKSKQSKAMYLLSSHNFNQAYKRLQYMKQYTAFRKKQSEDIIAQTNVVQKLNDSLLHKKQAKDLLIAAEKEQKKKIESDKKSQEKIVSIIKKKERKYRRELKKKQRQERKIAAKIDKIISDAIAKSNKNRKKGTKKSSGFILSPKAKALALKFEKNKGKLPWPVKEGLITRRFGVQSHPTIRGITINSTGLHFTTSKGAKAKAIFNGKVLGVHLTSEGKKSVLVQHGNYITAYNNLEKIYVNKGDVITTGQNIGQIFTDKVTGKTTLVFVLFKNTKKLNPSSWISRR